METQYIPVERLRFESQLSFKDTVSLVQGGIGHPNMAVLTAQLTSAISAGEFTRLVHAVVGSADLLEFLTIDLGIALRVNKDVQPSKMVRIIAGNPVIMETLTRYVPDAGSYAPVTLLIYEQQDRVCVCYDTMQSLLAPYGKPEVLEAARVLDVKVLALLGACERAKCPESGVTYSA